MKRLDARNLLIVLLFGAVLWIAADRSARAGADGGGGDADRGLIAVTGSYGSGASALYLVDTRTRHLCVYRLENGRELEFVAARDCSLDFLLEAYNDASPPTLSPSALRQSWQEFNRRIGTTPAALPGPPGTPEPAAAPAEPAAPAPASETPEDPTKR